MKFDIFIGIDQTGATNAKGEPKELEASLIYNNPKINFKTSLKLKTLSHQSILELIKQNVPKFESEKVLILIDAVFALPDGLEVDHQKILSEVKKYKYKSKSFGALTAFNFFNQFQKTEPIFYREIDLLLKAQSIFKLLPYQRNIGCGSYRILKELANDQKWYSIWPLEKITKQFVIAEGYPSYYWAQNFSGSRRDLKLLNKKFKNIKFSNMNEADSFMLALAAKKYQKQVSMPVNKSAKREGWVLGVPVTKNL